MSYAIYRQRNAPDRSRSYLILEPGGDMVWSDDDVSAERATVFSNNDVALWLVLLRVLDHERHYHYKSAPRS